MTPKYPWGHKLFCKEWNAECCSWNLRSYFRYWLQGHVWFVETDVDHATIQHYFATPSVTIVNWDNFIILDNIMLIFFINMSSLNCTPNPIFHRKINKFLSPTWNYFILEFLSNISNNYSHDFVHLTFDIYPFTAPCLYRINFSPSFTMLCRTIVC